MEKRELIERFHFEVRRFFDLRVVCLAAVLNRKSEPIQIGTAFLMVVDNLLVCVTAGHFLRSLHKWHQQGILDSLSLAVLKGKTAQPIDLAFTENSFFWQDDIENFDCGFVIPNSSVCEWLLASGVRAIPFENLGCEEQDSFDHAELIGFSAAGSIVRSEIIERFRSPGKAVDLRTTYLESINKRHVPLTNLKIDEDNPLKWSFEPSRERREKSLIGMSGGPIVAWRRGAQIREYRLLGIQSGQFAKKIGGVIPAPACTATMR